MWKHSTKLITLLIVLILVGCASPTGIKTDHAQATYSKIDGAAVARYQQAVRAMKNNRNKEALKLFKTLTAQHVNLSGAFVNMGLIYLKNKRYGDAEQALLQATKAKPTHAIAHNHLGIAYRELGQFYKAERAYKQALQIDVKYANAHLNIGILYDIYLGDLSRALHHYEQYLTLVADQDTLVKKWVIDIKHRHKKQQAQRRADLR